MKSSKPSTSQPKRTARPVGASQTAIAATIEEWAELQFAPIDIAFQVGLPVEMLERAIADGSHVYGQAFKRGRLKAEAVVAKSLYTLAQQGSSPAQRQFLDRIADRSNTGEPLESLVASEKRKETALADMRAMEAAKMRGELLDAAEVVRGCQAIVHTARANFRNLPSRLAADMHGLGLVEAEAVALREVDEVLTQLADAMAQVLARMADKTQGVKP